MLADERLYLKEEKRAYKNGDTIEAIDEPVRSGVHGMGALSAQRKNGSESDSALPF